MAERKQRRPAKRSRQNSTPEKGKQRVFLDHFRQYGNISMSARHAGIERTTVYWWQEHDEDFPLAFEQAKVEAVERLEEEARRRAVDGTERLKFGQGGRVIIDPDTGLPYREREYSDTLLIFLLKGLMPDRYAERRKSEVSGPNGGPVQIRTYADMSDDDIDAKLKAFAEAED